MPRFGILNFDPCLCYHAAMHRSCRRFVSLMLTIFLANMMAWSYSSEAMADWLTEERAQIVSGAVEASSSPANSHKDQQTCNHGCHAASHLQGQAPSPLPLFALDTAQLVFFDESFFLPLGIAQRQFRPPRLSSQA